MAGILLFVLLLGNLSEHTPKKYYDFLMLVHNSLGIIIFILVILRLFWRWSNPKPENIKDPAIKEFLIIDFDGAFLLNKTFWKIDIKNLLTFQNDNHFHFY